MEKLDILNEKGRKTGIARSRKETHLRGLWHQAAHVWIYNSKREILFQKRSIKKEDNAGEWDISAAGHISSGESPKKAALREMDEELGIKAAAKDVKKIGVMKIEGKNREGYMNREFDHIYLFKFEKLPKKLQKEEVEQVKFIPIKKFEVLIKNTKTAKKYVPHGKYYFDIIKAIKKELK